jgi:uncharacterized protein YyaL (SSP411 family)
MLVALDFHLGPVQEFAVVGDFSRQEMRRALQVIRSHFLPNAVIAARSTEGDSSLIPLLADKTARGPVTTYICQDFSCQAPLVGVEALQAALAAA